MEEILASIRRIIADDAPAPTSQRAPEQAYRAAPAERRRSEPAPSGYEGAARLARHPDPASRDMRGQAPNRAAPQPRAAAADGRVQRAAPQNAMSREAMPREAMPREALHREPAPQQAMAREQARRDRPAAGYAPEPREAYPDPRTAQGRMAPEPAHRGEGVDPRRFDARPEMAPRPGPERRPAPAPQAPFAAPPPLRFGVRGEQLEDVSAYQPAPPSERRPGPPPSGPRPEQAGPGAEAPRGARGLGPEAAPAGTEAAPGLPRDPRSEPPRVASRPAQDAPRTEGVGRRDLLSANSDAVVAAAFQSLGSLALPHKERTVEDLVKEILRPMLKDWLDAHLPGIVEQLVRAEIERVAGRPR